MSRMHDSAAPVERQRETGQHRSERASIIYSTSRSPIFHTVVLFFPLAIFFHPLLTRIFSVPLFLSVTTFFPLHPSLSLLFPFISYNLLLFPPLFSTYMFIFFQKEAGCSSYKHSRGVVHDISFE